MHLHLMSILLHLSLVPVKALLELADEGVIPPVGILFLLPLHGVLLGLVLVHLAREEASPPDVELVLTQLTLQAPLLGVGTANVVLDISLPCTGPGAALPGVLQPFSMSALCKAGINLSTKVAVRPALSKPCQPMAPAVFVAMMCQLFPSSQQTTDSVPPALKSTTTSSSSNQLHDEAPWTLTKPGLCQPSPSSMPQYLSTSPYLEPGRHLP
jgi:hypothetical protein